MTLTQKQDNLNRQPEIAKSRCLVRSIALFRLIIAGLTAVASVFLAANIYRAIPRSDFAKNLQPKWTSTFWVFSAASCIMALVALRLILLTKKDGPTIGQRQANGIRGVVMMCLVMLIIEVYGAVAAFIDINSILQPHFDGDANDDGYNPTSSGGSSNYDTQTFLIAVSLTFVILATLEVAVIVLALLYHRALRWISWWDAVDSAEKARNSTKHSPDEVEHFIRTSPETNNADGATQTFGSRPGKSNSVEELNGSEPPPTSASPGYPFVVINKTYDYPTGELRGVRRAKHVVPPLPPDHSAEPQQNEENGTRLQQLPSTAIASVVAGGDPRTLDEPHLNSPIDATLHDADSFTIGQTVPERNPPTLTLPLPRSPPSITEPLSDAADDAVNACLHPPLDRDQSNSTDGPSLPKETATPDTTRVNTGEPSRPQGEDLTQGQPLSPNKAIKRTPTFRRYEPRSSLRRSASSASGRSTGDRPVYEYNRFENYNPMLGTFQYPIEKPEDNKVETILS